MFLTVFKPHEGRYILSSGGKYAVNMIYTHVHGANVA